MDQNLEGALKDLSSIRRIMSQVATARGNPLSAPGSTNVSLFIHVMALVFSCALLIQELGLSPFRGGEVSASLVLQYSVASHLLRGVLIASIGVFLATLCIGLYAVLWTVARREQEDLSVYVARNFRSFSTLSFLSDLLVKFSGVAITIATGHPEWLSPFLLLCIADYLFQGRFFHLPVRVSFVAALVSLVVAGEQLYTKSAMLFPSILVFVVTTAISAGVVASKKRSFERATQAEVERHG